MGVERSGAGAIGYADMPRLSIICLVLLALVIAVPCRAADSERRTLVLFGASWCAPCIAELRGMRAIAASMPAGRIVIAWDDPGIARFRFERPANAEIASPARARALKAAFAGDAAGYPYAVMLDGDNHVCARWRRGITAEAVTAMLRECGGTRARAP